MDTFTDVPKVAICSGGIHIESLEVAWIGLVASLAASGAVTVIVGLVRSWRRRSRHRLRESPSESETIA